MRRFTLAIFAWWFLMAGPSGGFSTEVWTPVGPFKDEAGCKKMTDWVKSKRAPIISPCWEG